MTFLYLITYLLLSYCNGTRTHNHLVCKRQILVLCCEYLSVRCIWLSVLMSCTRFRMNPHSLVDQMSRNSEPKQSRYLKFKWLQRDSNPQPLKLKISRLFRERSSLTFKQLYRVWIHSKTRTDIIRTYSLFISFLNLFISLTELKNWIKEHLLKTSIKPRRHLPAQS